MKDLFRRAFALGLACLMAGISLAGCSGKNESYSDDKTQTAVPTVQPIATPGEKETAKPVETETAGTPQITAEPEEKTVEIYRQYPNDFGSYNNGIAKVNYVKVTRTISISGASEPISQRNSAYIDKEGKVLFRVPEGFYGSDFSNGYAFVSNDKMVYIIDESGKVMSKHSADKNDKEYVIKRGDGYVLTYEKASTFSASKFIYRIYDPSGQVVNTVESEKELELEYYGEGIFYTASTNKLPHRYWDKNGNSFIDKNDEENGWRYFGLKSEIHFNAEGKTVPCGFEYGSYGVVIMDTNGNTSIQGYPNGDYHFKLIGSISEDHLLVYTGDFSKADKNLTIASIDTERNSYRVMDKEYSSRISANTDSSIGVLSDGRYVFPLKGSDGEDYVGIFDSKLVPVCEPIPGYTVGLGFYDERIVIGKNTSQGRDLIIYDTEGNEIFSVEGVTNLPNYSDGVLNSSVRSERPHDISEDGTIITEVGAKGLYFNLDGNVLFEEIDFTSGFELVLE